MEYLRGTPRDLTHLAADGGDEQAALERSMREFERRDPIHDHARILESVHRSRARDVELKRKSGVAAHGRGRTLVAVGRKPRGGNWLVRWAARVLDL